MNSETVSAAYLLRLVGFFGIAIGAAWAVQTLGFGTSTLASRLLWVVAAASMSGAGTGLVIAAYGMASPSEEGRVRNDRLEPIFD